MRAVRRASDGVHVVDVDLPRGEGVVVSVEVAGLCGSDVHMLAMGPSPITMGHEFGGRLADGTLVAVRPTGMCGTCRMCTSGRSNICPDAMARFFGGVLDGGFADQVLVDPNCIFPMPVGAIPGAAALAEPIAVAVHGVRRVDLARGQKVAVIGAGSAGIDMCEYLLAEESPQSVASWAKEWGVDFASQAPGGLVEAAHIAPKREVYLLQRKEGKMGSGPGKTERFLGAYGVSFLTAV